MLLRGSCGSMERPGAEARASVFNPSWRPMWAGAYRMLTNDYLTNCTVLETLFLKLVPLLVFSGGIKKLLKVSERKLKLINYPLYVQL